MIFATSSHTIGFSDLCWCVGNYSEIKKVFTHVVHWDHVNRARDADQAARACEIFVYSAVKVTRFFDYQTWQTYAWEISCVSQRYLCFFLDCACWVLIGCEQQTPITLRLWAIYWKVSQLNCEFSIISMLDLNLIDQPSEGHKLTWYIMQSGFFFSENSIEGIFLFTALAPRLFS